MRFSVEAPDSHDPVIRHFEDGPTQPCWMGDEMCAFVLNGPCTQFECECETTGNCRSCPPPTHRSSRRVS